MMENPKKGVFATIGTGLGIGMCVRYGTDMANRLISYSSDYVTARATKALSEMMKQEAEEKMLHDHLRSILEGNESITKPFLPHMFKNLHSKIRVDRELKRLKRSTKDLSVWKDIQTKGFTQAMTSVYTLCLLHVLSATVASVFGRCHRQQEDADEEENSKWDVARERKIQCTELCVRYFQDHGLDKLIKKVQDAVQDVVTLISAEKEDDSDVNQEISLEMFNKVHDCIRRRVEDSIECGENDRISSNPFASYLLPPSIPSTSSSSSDNDKLLGVIRDVLSSPLCAILMHRIFDDAFQVYLEDIKTRIIFKEKESVLLGTLLSFLCIANFKGSFGIFSKDKNKYLDVFAKSRSLADYVSAIYHSSVLPTAAANVGGDNSTRGS